MGLVSQGPDKPGKIGKGEVLYLAAFKPGYVRLGNGRQPFKLLLADPALVAEFDEMIDNLKNRGEGIVGRLLFGELPERTGLVLFGVEENKLFGF